MIKVWILLFWVRGFSNSLTIVDNITTQAACQQLLVDMSRDLSINGQCFTIEKINKGEK